MVWWFGGLVVWWFDGLVVWWFVLVVDCWDSWDSWDSWLVGIVCWFVALLVGANVCS